MTVKVDSEACIGCGACVSFCPEVFEINDDGKAEAIAQKCDSCDVSDAVSVCPVGAITV